VNWNSKEGRALLLRAYPAGYLAVRGVLTLGGWTPGSQGFIGSLGGWRWHNPNNAWSSVVVACAHGDLLPLPDPADHATWACLLADLAAAGPPVEDPEGRYTMTPGGLTWRADGHRRWNLADAWRTVYSYVIDSDTDDPAEALVHARTQLRRTEVS